MIVMIAGAIIGDVNDHGVSGRKKVGVTQQHVQAA
jgi:hypothetical protein